MVPRYPQTSDAEFTPGSSVHFQSTLPPEVAKDAVVYVLAVVVLYGAIIVVLVGTNLHRFRHRPAEQKQSRPSKEVVRKTPKIPESFATRHDLNYGSNDVVLGTTDYIIDLDNTEDQTVVVPLLHNDVHLHRSDDQNFDESSYIESIEVIDNLDHRQTYAHTLIDPSILKEICYSGCDSDSQTEDKVCDEPSSAACKLSMRNADRNGNQSFTSQILQKAGKFSAQTASSELMGPNKISTTVVSRSYPSATLRQQQKVRVGLTAEEAIKPRGLLEMAGDDVGDPVAV
ncbi:hypothetical protein FHG87_008883 [Trinorchestia longiramus]|nr:hypothetical protein FHG87_008883 [Trinorchestia longiramus]